MSDNIYKRVAAYVSNLYETYPHPNLVFHNIDHTKKVVQRAQEIAGHYQLAEKETMNVYIAAWFHDTGHLFTDIEHHEDKSVEVMREYMQREEAVGPDQVNVIAGCILATRLPWEPKTQLEEIICDADTYHFGTKDFKTTNKQIKSELQLRGYGSRTQDWTRNTLKLLEKHVFYTQYCKVLLEAGKHKNIDRLKKKTLEKSADNVQHNMFGPELTGAKNDKQKESLLARGIQTIMRLTSSNHLHFSEMADRKANILISVNSIIISLILSVLVDKLSDSPYLTIPAILFLASSLATIIIAILSTRPKVTEGRFVREDIMNKKTNLLFFGNFYKSSLQEYEWAMATLMKDTDHLYTVLVMDIHQIGVVLGKKYKLIRLAYTIFMAGLIIAVAAFLIATFIHYGNGGQATTISTSSHSPL